ncbi:MAG: type II secretion system protein GspI [Betaproteobacteria bacterium]|nr:type II secretion system protein GspI [Betaproteobacteria bacterium]
MKRGFTLIEVLVALAIVALCVMAGMRAAGSMTRNAERQWQVLLAQACADNSLYRLRLASTLPNVGESRVACPQAGLPLDVVLSVQTTPNPAFRRVDAQVFLQNTPLLRVSTVLGRY